MIKSGENGFLVESGNTAELAKVIQTLIDDRPLGKKMGEAGYRFVQNELSWEKSVDQVEALLNQITN
ncbi:MAG: glycosyltransferase [Anaerolineae bacterium]